MLGICLGVAVVVAIDLSNYSAKSAFALSTDAIAGKATHYISSDSRGLSEEIYRKLRFDFSFFVTPFLINLPKITKNASIDLKICQK